MKIIFYDYHFLIQKFGGVSRYYYEIIKKLKKKKFPYKILALISFNYYIKKNKSNLLYINSSKNIKNFFLLVNKLYFKLMCIILNPKIIHFTEYNHLLINFKKISILTVYDFILEDFMKINEINKKKILIKNKCIQKANYLFTISKTVHNKIKKKFPKKRIFVTPLGVDHKIFYPDKIENLSICKIPNKNYLLFVGSRLDYKNFKMLLECYVKFSNLNDKYNLVIFGGENDLSDVNYHYMYGKKIFHVCGDDSLLRKLYSNTTLYINPSLDEGFGLPILEAMACKSPILCSDIDIFKEVTEGNSFYFDPKSKKDLLKKLSQLNNKKKNFNIYTEKAYKLSLNKSWDNVSNSIIEVYNVIFKENNVFNK